MITIELDTLITILVGLISIIASSVVTLFFSRRHYSRSTNAITETDLEFQKIRNEGRSELPGFLLVVLIILEPKWRNTDEPTASRSFREGV